MNNKVAWPADTIDGQESWLLASDTVSLAVSRRGAMLAPVRFTLGSLVASPYAIAPWSEEELPLGMPPFLQALRGDWFCSAFGANDESWRGRKLPLHGETANALWEPLARGADSTGCWMSLVAQLPVTGARCVATTGLRAGETVIYQTHELSALEGPINPGHHATIRFPDGPESGRLSFSRPLLVRSLPGSIDGPTIDTPSRLASDAAIANLARAPTSNGETTDLTRFPARPGFDDIVIVCADPTLPFAWSTVTFGQEGYAWFALRNPRHFASTMLWFSNGGRSFAPFSGRHVNVMGIEDITAYFHFGIAASARSNPLSEAGVATMLEPDSKGNLTLPYIQGVAAIPPDFDQVAEIQPGADARSIRLVAESGASVDIACAIDFLNQPDAAGLACWQRSSQSEEPR